jgi:hypothetical protein
MVDFRFICRILFKRLPGSVAGFLGLIFCSYVPGFAQKESLRLSSQEKLQDDSIKIYKEKHVAFDFQFDNRNSFIKNNAVNIQGINIGLDYASGVRWGIGAYRIIQPSRRYLMVDKQKVATNRELDLYFVTPNFQYTFFRRKWIETSVVLEVGFGKIVYKVLSEDLSKILRERKGFFIPAGAGLDVLITPIRWAGVEGLIGYRKSLKTYDINQDFDGIFYSYGIKIFIGAILDDLKYHAAKKKYKKGK